MTKKFFSHPVTQQSFVFAFWFFFLQLTYSLLIKLLNSFTLLDCGLYEFWNVNSPLTTPLMLGEDVLVSGVFTALGFALWRHRITRVVFLVAATCGFALLAFDQLAYEAFFSHVNFILYRESHDIERLQSSIADLIDVSFFVLLIAGIISSVFLRLSWRPRWIRTLAQRWMKRPFVYTAVLIVYVIGSYVLSYFQDNTGLHRAFSVELAETFFEHRLTIDEDGKTAEWRKFGTIKGEPQPEEDFLRVQENIEKVARHTRLNVVHYIVESTPYRESSLNPGNKFDTTPFLKELSQKGMSFENYYVVFPGSTRSDFSSFTGYYPYIDGASDIDRFAHIDVAALSDILHDRGYRTALFSSGDTWYDDFDKFLKNHSYDKYEDLNTIPSAIKAQNLELKWGVPEEYSIDKALKWIGDNASSQKPFLLQYIATYPHHPYEVPQKYKEQTRGNWRDKDERTKTGDYRRSLRYADLSVELLFKGLEKLGVLENTLVVVTSDHGEALGELRKNQRFHTGAVYEENIHIPCVFYNRAIFEGTPNRSRRVGSEVDLMPTILDLLNIELPKGMEGQSLVSDSYVERPLFFNSNRHFGMRDGNFKAIYNKDDESMELYDLSKDPDEQKNIAENHSEKLSEYFPLMYAWQRDINRMYKKLKNGVAAKKTRRQIAKKREKELKHLEIPIRSAVVCERKECDGATESSKIPVFHEKDKFALKMFWRNPGSYAIVVSVENPKGKRIYSKGKLKKAKDGESIERLYINDEHYPLMPGKYKVNIHVNQKEYTTRFKIDG